MAKTDTYTASVEAAAPDRFETRATARQINYLNNLRDQDPAFASTVGMPTDLLTLTKSRASDLIKMMLSNR